MKRREFLGAAAMAAAWPAVASLQPRAPRPRPSRAQLAWQRDELAIFIHFGVNTFTNREWGDGTELPSIFAPSKLDARQWARAAKAGGARAMVLTAKHHDGFCLWPTRTTTHSVAASPFRAGAGDVVREFVDACRAEGLRPGLYLSPWDRNNPHYGDSPRYNDLYAEQLTELLSNYGPLAEVWFDGANGEGPNGKRQVYDWPRVWALVRRLQPEAVMFSDAGPDVRWCGNEHGTAGDPNWSTIDPAAVPFPGATGDGIIAALQHGHRDGSVWRPAEADTSIRPGWFYHPAEDARVKTAAQLADIYLKSVGRNSKLLLNVPPTPDGLLHQTDVDRLEGFHSSLRRMFNENLIDRLGGGMNMVRLKREAAPQFIRLEEPIDRRGQVVERYEVEGALEERGPWLTLSRGTTIGYAKIDRIPGVSPMRFVRVKFPNAAPADLAIKVYA